MYGWQPIVVSPRTPSKWNLYDYTIQIPPGIEIHDAKAYQNIWVAKCRYLLRVLPDNSLFMFTSYLKGVELLRKKNDEIHCIYATSPSSSALFSGYFLSKRFGKPLVLDFRDPFYASVIYKSLYRKVLNAARINITTTEEYRDILIQQGSDRDKIKIIPNGADVEAIETIRNKGIIKSKDFTIVYAGILIRLYRLKTLLRAMVQLRSLNIRVVIIGRIGNDNEGLVDFAKKHDLSNVEFRGRLSQDETIQELLKATIAYNGSAHKGGIGGKMYDYIACGLPIIGYNPKGSATSSFIEKYGVGLTDDTEEGFVKSLKMLYDNPSSIEFMSKNAMNIAKNYNRKDQAKNLSDLLNDIKA